MHHDGTVQTEPLSCGIRLDASYRNDYHRRILCRFIVALGKFLDSMPDFYLNDPRSPHGYYDYPLPFVRDDRRRPPAKRPKNYAACFFPHPESYSKLHAEGEEVSFEYVDHMVPERLLFQAVEVESKRPILVKFTRCYGVRMHELLASQNLAPKLYGCQDVAGGWKMIVMEFLPREEWVMLSSKEVRPSIDRGGDDASSASRSLVDLVLPLLPRLWGSVDRKELAMDEGTPDGGGETGANRSCSAFVALRMQTVLPISVTVSETWLAAASSRLTGDMPAPVACVFAAATRLLSVASARSRRACSASKLTSARSREGRRSNARTSSTIAVTAFTTDFMGVSTLVGALDRPAVSRLSIAETNAVT